MRTHTDTGRLAAAIEELAAAVVELFDLRAQRFLMTRTRGSSGAAEGPAACPEFIRLPKPAERCPWTGLSRTSLVELILPAEWNGFKPPVRSVHLKRRGTSRGMRLVDFKSLMAYLRECDAVGEERDPNTPTAS